MQTPSEHKAAAANTAPARRRVARRWVPLAVPIGLFALILLAVTVGFPIARTLIMTINAALFPLS